MDEAEYPAILLVYSEVGICPRCSYWWGRYPLFYGAFTGGKGDYCDRCGCSSVRIRPGRPFGPRSRHWDEIVGHFKKYVLSAGRDGWWEYRDMVKTNPPLPTYEETYPVQV